MFETGFKSLKGFYKSVRYHGGNIFSALLLTVLLLPASWQFNVNAQDENEQAAADLPQIAYFNAESMRWYRRGQHEDDALTIMKWGESGDIPVTGDFDGDGIQDNAVWRASNGMWYIHRSSDDRLMGLPLVIPGQAQHQRSSNIPVTGDYDGDGKTDLAIFRPDNGFWYILLSSKDFDASAKQRLLIPLGIRGDIPVQADYDGDGKTDPAVFRPSTNTWHIIESQSGNRIEHRFGESGDILVPADYTGDGRADLAVYRKDKWYVRDSSTGTIEPFHFGFEDAVPVPADYDGDGIIDFAVFRNGLWYLTESSTGNLRTLDFGRTGDVPLPVLATRRTSN